MPTFSRELAAGGLDAGVDEVGRGAWAGPVYAGAAILSSRAAASPELKQLDDSKAISKKMRGEFYRGMLAARDRGEAWLAIGTADPTEIDKLNILGATLLAMQRAIANLPVAPDLALIDGNRAPDLACPSETVVGGDAEVLSIAAASIFAKVTRDAHMCELAVTCPGYGWERNAGYGTREHQDALKALGATPHHRQSFAPIKNIVEGNATYR